MPSILRWPLLAALLTSGFAFAQTSLHLKTRRILTDSAQSVHEIESPKQFGRGHLLMQFHNPPTAATIAALKHRGATVLADVPENGLLISVERRIVLFGLGVRYAAPIDPSDKISPIASEYVLAELYSDVDPNDVRGLILNLGLELRDNPDLNPHHLMVRVNGPDQIRELATLDEVAYIFPASDDLVNGVPVRASENALTTNGASTQSIPTYGDGWDGPGLGAATVSYVFSKMTAQLPASAAQAEILRAMEQWHAAVQVTWQPGTNPYGPRTVNILWGTYAHGDAYPFDGPGGVLAHTFYPANPNPEPIAGDMHLDDSESWRIGANIDLFSVTLHELGHALGLGHSDNPNDVMYPYYKLVTKLAAGDISAAQTLYAAQGGSGGTPPGGGTPNAQLTLTVNSPAAATIAAAINLSGSASGGSGAIVVSWSASSGASGMAQGSPSWSIGSIPLMTGRNVITVTAVAGSSRVSQSITVTRQAAPPTGGSDTTPPTLTIGSPAATSIWTSSASIAFSGTASDNVGVVHVTWATNTGSSGTASGTSNWSATVPLLVGSNTVIIRAADAAGNVAWRSAVVTRH